MRRDIPARATATDPAAAKTAKTAAAAAAVEDLRTLTTMQSASHSL